MRGEEAAGPETAMFSVERLMFFSDAVVAIAITLLALELPVPLHARSNADLLSQMRGSIDDYIGFLISFAVIGTHWLGHHRVFGYMARVGGTVTRWNMLWLLMIVLTPFATRLLVGDGAFAVRFSGYAIVQALASIFLLLAVYEMDHRKLVRDSTPRTLLTLSYRRLAFMAGAFLVSIPLAFVTRWAYVCWVAIPMASRLQKLYGDIRRRGDSNDAS